MDVEVHERHTIDHPLNLTVTAARIIANHPSRGQCPAIRGDNFKVARHRRHQPRCLQAVVISPQTQLPRGHPCSL